MENRQMSIDQWMNYFTSINKSNANVSRWNQKPLATGQQFNTFASNKPTNQFSNSNMNSFNSANFNSQFVSSSNRMPTSFFNPNNSNFPSYDNLTQNGFGSLYENKFNFDNLSFVNNEEFLKPKRKTKKDYSSRPIVYIANIDDYRNGYRDDYESDDYDSDYDDYESVYDDYDSEYDDDYEDDYYSRPAVKSNHRKRYHK